MFRQFWPLLALAPFCFSGCEEKPIVIPDLQVGNRKVLVEELTGVRCTNCPKGAADLEALRQVLGDQLIVVGLHSAAGYDEPYSDSKYDFRNADCRAVTDYLYVNGDPGAPAAAIDRVQQSGETEIFINRPWGGAVNASAASDPETGLYIVREYDAATRELKITVNIAPEKDLSGDLRLSVYITEDSIQDFQLKDGVRIPDYTHRHVFRDAVSAPTGDPISEPLLAGGTVSKSFTTTLSTDWKAQQCSVVAFVHRHGAPDSRRVLQADEKHVIE
jgi:hypothetical protein